MIILGILGCALARYPDVRLLGFTFLSNHFHLLLRLLTTAALPAFMNLATSKLAREVAGLHDWKGAVFAGPYTAIPVLDDLALLGRQHYVAAHGCKERLVLDPEDWPGVGSLRALAHGEKLSGLWFDRKTERLLRRYRAEPPVESYTSRFEVPIDPLPCMEQLDPSERMQHYVRMLGDIRDDAQAELCRSGKPPLGAKRVLALDPHSIPRTTKRGPAPLCHTSDPELRRRYEDAYRQVRDDFHRAAELLRKGNRDVQFPPYTFPPPQAPVTAEAPPKTIVVPPNGNRNLPLVGTARSC